MKLKSKLAGLGLLCCTALPVSAEPIDDLVQYFQYLGNYLGYDVTQSPTKSNKDYNVSYELLNMVLAQNNQTYAVITLLGSMAVNSYNDNVFANFEPEGAPGADQVNFLANYTYKTQNYSSPSTSNVSVSKLVDQPNFQDDPVTQSIYNIIGTPDYSYCMTIDGSSVTKNCDYLTENQVTNNVIGFLPDAKTFFAYDYVQQFMSQLNSNSLVGPLLYSTESPGSKSTGSPVPGAKKMPGLVAQTQAQQAENFVRYATGAVSPLPLPRWKDYNDVYTQATASATGDDAIIQQQQAWSTLTNYLTTLRTYAAQSSVGISNLYYILSKRLPQNSVGEKGSTGLSQALAEFNMATWRIYNNTTKSPSSDTQWINQINNSSPATVEKEIAVLLAEINYQMYLDRQIQERMLLTNSIMLIQNTRNAQPSANFSSAPSSKAPSSSTAQ